MLKLVALATIQAAGTCDCYCATLYAHGSGDFVIMIHNGGEVLKPFMDFGPENGP